MIVPRLHIGVGIGADALRAVGVHHGRIAWALECVIQLGEPVDRALAELLARAPLPRWPRPLVTVAIGPSRVQTKRLAGLPPVRDARALAQIVREGAGRFFLRNGIPLVTSAVQVDQRGHVWAAAFDEPVVAQVERACGRLRLPLLQLLPAVAVIGHAIGAERVVWHDGTLSCELELRGGHMESVRRASRDRLAPRPAVSTDSALGVLGEDAWRYADAFGATLAPRRAPLGLRRATHFSEGAPVPRWRMAFAVAAFAAALVIAALVPALSARHSAAVAAERLREIAPERAAAVRVERDLALVTEALGEVSELDARRRSRLALLAAIARGLPDGSALSAFRVDSLNGSVVGLAPRGAIVLAAAERAAEVVSPEIIGPVTKEVVGGKELERVTVRFRLAPPKTNGR